MAVSTISIPLVPLASATTTATRSTTNSNATSGQHACGSLSGSGTVPNSSTTPSNALAPTALAPAGTPSNATASQRAPKIRARAALNMIGQGFITFAILLATYLTFSTALWTAAKDFRDDCRSQNSTFGLISQECARAMQKSLDPPLGLSMFLHDHVRRAYMLSRRASFATSEPIQLLQIFSATWLTAVASLCVTMIIALCKPRHFSVLPLRSWFICKTRSPSLQDGGRPIRDVHLPSNWVANTIPRLSKTTMSTSVEYDIPIENTSKRHVAAMLMDSADASAFSDWLPAGCSVTMATRVDSADIVASSDQEEPRNSTLETSRDSGIRTSKRRSWRSPVPELYYTTSSPNDEPFLPPQLHLTVYFDKKLISMIISSNIRFRSLTDRIDVKLARLTNHSIASGSLRLKYQDEDGDFIWIDSDEAVHDALLDWKEKHLDKMITGRYPELRLLKKLALITYAMKK